MLMNGEEITRILDEIRRDFQIDTEAEISLEANPGTLTEKKLKLSKRRNQPSEPGLPVG